jgi:alkylated DNA repair protein (DNA oxidative demethylase)
MSLPSGFTLLKGYLDRAQQEILVSELRQVVKQSPLYTPTLGGNPFNLKMTNCGELGWIVENDEYKYIDKHPVTGKPWLPIPNSLIQLSRELLGDRLKPQSCLINLYSEHSKLGLHVDKTEKVSKPILSISLGDDAVFLMGRIKKSQKVEKLLLQSGDIVILADEARSSYHGIEKINFRSSDLLKNGGRLNLTIRQVY